MIWMLCQVNILDEHKHNIRFLLNYYNINGDDWARRSSFVKYKGIL